MATTRRGTTKKTAPASAGNRRAAGKPTAGNRRAAGKPTAGDVDYTRSTGAYPMGPTEKQPSLGGAADDDIDYGRSTMAYPMGETTAVQLVDQHFDEAGNPIDFAKSVDRYPMYGEHDPRQATSYDLEQIAEVRVETPGPRSDGEPDGSKGWKAQRDRLGLDKTDPTGESDTNWKPEDARMTHPDEEPGVPHTTPEGEPVTHEAKHPDTATPATDVKTVGDAQAKVVKPPAKQTPATRSDAETK